MKYIIVDGQPILFSEGLVHKDVAIGWRNIESAGFVALVPISDWGEDHEPHINATVSGESFSLGIKNRGVKDEQIIERVINNHY